MMKFHGMPKSNYANMVKHCLYEKGIAFENINIRPSQEPDFLRISPLGKVPVLETAQGFLTETNVIMDYLEETHPEPALFPHDAFARAKVKQLMKVQELYVETPIHALVGVIFGREVPEHVKQATPDQARRGLAALQRLAKFEPFLCGDRMTYADIFAYYSFTLSNLLTQTVYQWDILDEVPGLRGWFDLMGQQPVTRRVVAEMGQ